MTNWDAAILGTLAGSVLALLVIVVVQRVVRVEPLMRGEEPGEPFDGLGGGP